MFKIFALFTIQTHKSTNYFLLTLLQERRLTV